MTPTEIIEKYGLKTSNRHREFVWRRQVFCKWMVDQGFTQTHVSHLLGKHHASIINALKQFNINSKYPDFHDYCSDIYSDLYPKDEPVEQPKAEIVEVVIEGNVRELEDKILKCVSYSDFTDLQKQIRKAR